MFQWTRSGALLMVALASLAACEDSEGPDTDRFFAELSGAEEVPARTTPALGFARFTVQPDNSITYSIDVDSLRNVFAAHIHGPAPAGTNAGIIVDLFTSATPVPSVSGPLVTGTLTTTNNPTTVSMDSLLVLMRNGQAYVNVHTNDLAAPTNTGPGDFPGGEIRGQIQQN